LSLEAPLEAELVAAVLEDTDLFLLKLLWQELPIA